MGFESAVGTVVIFRQPALSGGAVVFSVRIDGVEVGKIRPNDRLRFNVAPGHHRIQATMWSRQGSHSVDFHVAPGQQVGFVCQGTMKPLHPIDLVQSDSVLSGAPAPSSQAYPPAPVWGGDPRGGGVPQQSAAPSRPARVEVIESGQFEELLGEEVRVIDNQHSATGVTRSVKASREWSRTVSIATEHVRTFGAELGGGPAWLRVKGSVEDELHRTYSTEDQTKRVFAEEITITVPARTSVRLALRWKRIWQRGVVRVTQADGTTYEVPFQVVVNVTFDQSQQDGDGPDRTPAGGPASSPAGSPDIEPTMRMYWTPPEPGRPAV